ncbi:PLP-dependent aminotransferase family protein [Castellaniella sp.]|uniref:aminotransferase-like domain-containing protein n=1 Tax=Castellaniella sp. TaxID=1955812 RepID=UPI002AFDD2A9|nr:PLP-dependent aminotransferase family protein [Castellaniella sp.]
MIFFIPDRRRKETPSLVDQTVAALEHAIQQKTLRPGMVLPSIRQFSRDHGLSTFTVTNAYNRLVARGLVQSQPGANFRVSRQKPVLQSSVPQWVMPRIGSSWLLADVFADHSISIKAGCGWLPPDWHDEAGLPPALRQISRAPVSQVSSYGHPLGYHPLRELITQRLQDHGLDVEPNQILLTHGATQALDIAVRTILRPGDHVAVESPCYANLLQILALSQIVVHAVPRTREGICEQTLEDLAAQHPIRAMFVTTVLQNPTGASFSMAGAFRLLQLAERHDFLVVEDDVSRDLLPEPAPLLAALAGTSRVIHISGFSKNVMPSTRVGYLTCAKPLVEQCTHTKMSLGLTSAELMERAVFQVLRDGRHSTYMRSIRERLHRAHDQVATMMQTHAFDIWTEPGAGLFLWARPPYPLSRDSMISLAARALQAGIWLAPGSYFDPEGQEAGWFRFNVAYSANPRLWQFFQEERERAESAPPSNPSAKTSSR